jgi:hypothetical protein
MSSISTTCFESLARRPHLPFDPFTESCPFCRAGKDRPCQGSHGKPIHCVQRARAEGAAKRRSHSPLTLSSADKRLLLAASFRLFLRRLSHGVAVRRDDILRVSVYGD